MADRASLRANWEPKTHFTALDQDVDDVLNELRQLRLDFNARMDKQDRRQNWIMTTMVSCLVTLVGGLVLLVLTAGAH